MTRTTYNDNREYELMAHIINDQLSPYDEVAREDVTQILRYCYIFTADEGKPNERTAGELGRMIVAYLAGSWGVPDFEIDAKEFWNPPAAAPEPPEDHDESARSDATDQLLIP